ncbi:hypothetical protein BASA81_006203 [Batrachochytrium salamandrivorans]|nr:hypothetical protein BASA81_006203 [Batrachochytrium salamandrivorans]
MNRLFGKKSLLLLPRLPRPASRRHPRSPGDGALCCRPPPGPKTPQNAGSFKEPPQVRPEPEFHYDELPVPDDLYEKLYSFYSKHDPKKTNDLDKVMTATRRNGVEWLQDGLRRNSGSNLETPPPGPVRALPTPPKIVEEEEVSGLVEYPNAAAAMKSRGLGKYVKEMEARGVIEFADLGRVNDEGHTDPFWTSMPMIPDRKAFRLLIQQVRDMNLDSHTSAVEEEDVDALFKAEEEKERLRLEEQVRLKEEEEIRLKEEEEIRLKEEEEIRLMAEQEEEERRLWQQEQDEIQRSQEAEMAEFLRQEQEKLEQERMELKLEEEAQAQKLREAVLESNEEELEMNEYMEEATTEVEMNEYAEEEKATAEVEMNEEAIGEVEMNEEAIAEVEMNAREGELKPAVEQLEVELIELQTQVALRTEAYETAVAKFEQLAKEAALAEEDAKRQEEDLGEWQAKLELAEQTLEEMHAEAERARVEQKRLRLEEEERLRLEVAEKERLRLEEEVAEKERLRLEEEAAERERLRLEEEAAEKERLRLEEEAAEKERLRLEEEAAEKERLRLEEEAAEKERLRLEAEAAEKERLRLEAEAAEKERLRQEEEAAEKERLRLEVAEKERLRLEEEAKQDRLRLEAESAEKERLKLAKEQADLDEHARIEEEFRIQEEREERDHAASRSRPLPRPPMSSGLLLVDQADEEEQRIREAEQLRRASDLGGSSLTFAREASVRLSKQGSGRISLASLTPCDEYRVDLVHPIFATCLCGHARKDHAGKAFQATTNPPERRSVNLQPKQPAVASTESNKRPLPPPPVVDDSPAASFHDRLVVFYSQYNPDKLEEIPIILKKFAGREQIMFNKLQEKYPGSII